MKVILAGGMGYVGSIFRKELEKRNINVLVFDDERYKDHFDFGHRLSYQNIPSFLHAYKCDLEDLGAIIMCAGHSSVPMCREDPEGAFKNNVSDFLDVVSKVEKHVPIIYMSSSCVYSGIFGATENSDLHAPLDMLAHTKLTLDRTFAMLDRPYYALRLGTVNGPSSVMRGDLIINSMVRKARTENKISVTNLESYRPVLGTRDLSQVAASVIEDALNGAENTGVYNVASFNTKVIDVAERVREVIGSSRAGVFPDIEVQQGLPVRSYDFTMSSRKFSETFEYEFQDTLESIITSLDYDWNFHPREIKRNPCSTV